MFRIVLISDTHNRHPNIYVLKPEDSIKSKEVLGNISGGVFLPSEADMVIHAGDMSNMGEEYEVENFLKWFSSLPYKYKILIAGNHDWLFDIQRSIAQDMLKRFPDIIYLENDFVEIEMIDGGDKLKIWGSPITPWFHSWAFNKARGEDINRYWAHIPDDVDILVTHGPPKGILDMILEGEQRGCEMLLERVKKIRPKISCFGHIHEAYGHEFIDGTHFVNASVVNRRVQLQNRPIIFEVDENKNFTRIPNEIPK
jgi:Icc-related predicted phosphoesterase